MGYQPHQQHLLTRDPSKPMLKDLRKKVVDIVQVNLEDPTSLRGITKGCTGYYIHSTSSDTAVLDAGEVDRARNLCHEIEIEEEEGNIRHVVCNSVAAEPHHSVGRTAQKHDVEQVFQHQVEELLPKSTFFASLSANVFMEELWKI